MIFPLFWSLIKKNFRLWVVFAVVLMVYLVIMAATFDQLKRTMQSSEFLGMVYNLDSRLMLLAGTYFDMLIIIFPMVFYVIMANKLVSKTVDDSSMSAYLSSSMSRKQYIVTVGLFFLSSVAALFIVVFVLGGLVVACYEGLDFAIWANLVFTIMFCSMAVAMISFFLSCAYPASRKGSMFLIGIPILFVLFDWLGQMPSLDFLQYLTPFSFPDSVKLAYNTLEFWWLMDIVFIAVIAGLFYASVKVFEKKQLSV